jgi:hypothetical protein
MDTHLLIAAISAFSCLIWALSALQRAGFDLNSLNPFLAYRRWQWRRSTGAKSISRIEHPMEATAVLLTARSRPSR